MRIREMARKGHNPANFLAALAGGVSIETQLKIEAAQPKLAEMKRSPPRGHAPGLPRQAAAWPLKS